MNIKKIVSGVLEVAYYEFGPRDGWPCILCHGFPYDAHAYDASTPILADAGARVIVPFLRGYGETRFLSTDTIRSGEQAALGADLLSLMDSLGIEKAVLGGYDWGGRAACIVAALWPERVTGLVSGNSYNIQNIARAMDPVPAKQEAAFWYQYYFHCERGRRGLTENRRDIIRLLWQMWSPVWPFHEDTFQRSARSFDNPDFVDVVIHSYRHRYGLVDGDPAVKSIENELARSPDITVPTLCVDGKTDGVGPQTSAHARHFTGPYEYRLFQRAGHNLPQEQPKDWAKAVLDVRAL